MKNGKFKTTVKLPTDQQDSYEFRYKMLDQEGKEHFDNDWEADGYRPNAFGEDNSIVQVTH